MIIIPTEENTSTVTDMRVDADGLLRDVEKKGMKYIFQKSKPKVVMMNMKLFKRLVEDVEDWEDQQRVYEIEKEPLGEGISLEDAAKEFGIKLHRKV
jgi:hypothetical protein